MGFDIVEREKTSLYPWRGQFSPGLVDIILDVYARDDTVVIDPFVGSGTTIFEATRKRLKCYDSDLNPAAIYFAKQAKFASLNILDRRQVLAIADQLIEKYIGDYLSPTLLRSQSSDRQQSSI